MVFSCDDVLSNCFGGQFGYADADYIPIGLHLAVMEGNSSIEEEKFCRWAYSFTLSVTAIRFGQRQNEMGVLLSISRTYQQLETCVRKYIFSCQAKDPIWKKWAATELLHASICSYNNKQSRFLLSVFLNSFLLSSISSSNDWHPFYGKVYITT